MSRLWKKLHPHVKAVKLYFRSFSPLDALKATWLHVRGLLDGKQREMTISRKNPNWTVPPVVRIPADDIFMYNQVFNKMDYAMKVRKTPSIIIDAGANIGSASIWFANAFPSAKIIAIEPEDENFKLLKRNTAACGNVTAVQAALWSEPGELTIISTDGLGESGYMIIPPSRTPPKGAKVVQRIHAVSLPSLMEEFGLDKLDIVKIDIEGSEREVFEKAAEWIGMADTIIVELHERMKPGCNRAFYENTPGFPHEWTRGENIFLSRGLCAPER